MSRVLSAFLLEGLLCLLVGMPGASRPVCDAMSLLLMAVNALLLVNHVGRRYGGYSRKVVQALTVSVFLKCLLVLWDYYGTSVFVLPNSHSDSWSFHYGAVAFARNWNTSVENYSFVVGGVYALFGVQRMTAQFLNVILGFVGIDFLERALRRLGISSDAREATLRLAAYLPNYLIISSILIRECLISAILCLSLYHFVLWWRSGNPIHLAVAYLASLGGCYFHSGAIAVAVGYALIQILTARTRDGGRVVHVGARSVALAWVFFVGFLALFQTFSDSLLHKFQGMEMRNIERYIDEHDFYKEHAEGSSAYSAGIAGYGGVTGIAVNAPIRLVYFLFVPMPWDWRGPGDVIAFLGSSLFYGGTAIWAFRMLRKGRPTPDRRALLLAFFIIAMTSAFVFSWGVESAGSALRHREKFYFAYLMLFAVLQDEKSKRILGKS